IADGYQFLLGFEESYGYLMGDYARDKDAVGDAAMIAEMAAYYHLQGKTLYDVMMECYEKYGYYSELTMNLVMPGLDGLEKMQKLMKMLHEDPPKSFAGFGVASIANHLTGKKKTGDVVEDLPEHLVGSNVIAFTLDNGAELIIRPSGTEPKIKVYIMVKVDSMEKAEEIKASLSAAVKALTE
ncbi:MAG: phospho-sugar mutase, partial [Clostridia bacterium]|nr:phospho-sugar mutase [Clostridia bacterium]